MKISKLNHTRFSVSNTKKEANHIKGHLYPNPIKEKSKEEKTADFVRHAIGQIKNSGLYSIFVPCPEEAEEQEAVAYNTIKMNAQDITDILMKTYDRDTAEARLIAKISAVKKHHFSSEICVAESSAERFVDFCVDNCLRKSLRKVVFDGETKYYLPDLIKELLKITCVNGNYEERISEYSYDKLRLVIKYLDEDVNKKEQLKDISNSIDNQNVKVQVFRNGKDTVLKLSNAEKKKQAPLFKFIADYAGAEIKERNLLLAKLRGYITLFITGESTYDVEADVIKTYDNESDKIIVPRIQFISELPDNSVDFSAEAGEIISQIYQNEAEIESAKEVLKDISDKNEKSAAKKNLDRKKRDILLLKNKYQRVIKDKLWLNFRNAKESIGEDAEGIFWVTYILDEADKMLTGKNINEKKNGQTYLINALWKNMVAYIGSKYIDMGKAVYHFAMPQNINDLENNKVFGKVRPEFATGITSFDYEMIKASETLQREVSMYLTFAINNFAQNTVSEEYRKSDNNEDILLPKTIKNVVLMDDMKRRYLQFFGGQSRWVESAVIQDRDKDLFKITAELFYNLRNENFHYTGRTRTSEFENVDIIQKMFEFEIAKSGSSFRKKYYSNNVLMFYSSQDITGLMDYLYDKPKYIPAQIPSFSNIISRINVENFLTGYEVKIGIEDISSEDMLKYHNSIYFILKEIYYYGFLQQDNLADRFRNAMEKYKTNHDEKWNQQAYDHFIKRVDEILNNKATSTVFSELCQRLITDFEQQNTDYRVRSSKTGDKDIFRHYKMLLYLGIRNAFREYLESINVYDFLKKPVLDIERFKTIDEDTFCDNWLTHMYDTLLEDKDNSLLLSWYVTAHFLDAKQINHLMGDFKNNIAFSEDIIKRRESLTGKKCDVTELTRKNDLNKKIISMLEFVQKQTNIFTNNVEDYFEDANEYAEVISKYYDFDISGTYSKALFDFSKKKVEKGSPTETVGMFYDAENLIINRNVLMASMYGNNNIIAQNFEKINYGEICEYYGQMDELKDVFKRNYCESKEEQIKLREYQNEKNRMELTDVLIYSEIINECLSKLISWTYLRERDLMYFQLGMQYVKLYHTDKIPKDEKWLRSISCDDSVIEDGAILYEIVSMNDYDTTFFKRKKEAPDEVEKAEKISTGTKVGMFADIYGVKIYAEGLEFFENYNKDHDEVVKFRNYIEHFKYFVNTDRSILDLYSDAYDRLFDYNLNFRKSVIYVLENILLRYFAIGHVCVTKTDEDYDYLKCTNNRKAAKLDLKSFEQNALVSDKMTYTIKINDNKNSKGNKGKKLEIKVPARSELFMKQLEAILRYHK